MTERLRELAGAYGYVVSLTDEPNFYAIEPHTEPYNVRTVTLTKPSKARGASLRNQRSKPAPWQQRVTRRRS